MTTAGELRLQLEQISRQLQRLNQDRQDLARAREALGDFKPAAYERAMERLENRRRLGEARSAVAEAASRLQAAEEDVAHQRDLLVVVDVHEAAARRQAAEEELGEVRLELEGLWRISAWDRLRRHWRIVRLRRHRAQMILVAKRRRNELRETLKLAEAHGVLPVVGSDLTRTDIHEGLETARSLTREIAAELAQLDAVAETLRGNGLATSADLDLVERERTRWQEHWRLLQLEAVAGQQEQRRRALELDRATAIALLERMGEPPPPSALREAG